MTISSGQIMKDKERLRKCHRLEENKETQQVNVMWTPGLNAEVENGQHGKLGIRIKFIVQLVVLYQY